MPKLEFVADTPIYTTVGEASHKAWRMEDAQLALASAHERGKPVVIFVHGRGREPNKSLQGATWAEGLAVWKLERGYDCSVVMLNWDSAFDLPDFKDRARPLGNAPEGARRLAQLLEHLATFQSTHPDLAKPSLLAHSMGSIVIQQAVESGAWPQGPLFSTVLLSQPDADDIGHGNWLTELGRHERVLCTLNADDHVLRKSKRDRPPGARALGLGATEPLASGVKYIDLTSMGALGATDDDHEVFGKGAMNGQVNVCKLFEQALLGEDVALDDTNVASIDRGVIYKLRLKSDPHAPGLKVPALPKFKKKLFGIPFFGG